MVKNTKLSRLIDAKDLRPWLVKSYQPARFYVPWNSLVQRYSSQALNNGVVKVTYITCVCVQPGNYGFYKTF